MEKTFLPTTNTQASRIAPFSVDLLRPVFCTQFCVNFWKLGNNNFRNVILRKITKSCLTMAAISSLRSFNLFCETCTATKSIDRGKLCGWVCLCHFLHLYELFYDTSTLVGHSEPFPRKREESNRTTSRGQENEKKKEEGGKIKWQCRNIRNNSMPHFPSHAANSGGPYNHSTTHCHLHYDPKAPFLQVRHISVLA